VAEAPATEARGADLVAADFLAGMAERSAARAADLDEAALALAATRAPLSLLPTPGRFQLFAEVKRSSPSEGALHTAVDPAEQALAYARGGACAVSVLTEPSRFGGSLDDLRAVAAALRPLGVPAIRKDFLVDRRQVLEARAAGASGVLLIAAILDDDRLVELAELALGLGMFVLLEAFDEEEVDRLDAISAPWLSPERHGRFSSVFIGLNCRDLRTLRVDPDRFATVRRPRVATAIAESGIHTPADATRVAALGWSGALVGTALMRSEDPEAAASALIDGGHLRERRQVKLCGLRTAEDVRNAQRANADLFGFVVVESPRRVQLSDLPDLAGLVGRQRAVAVMRDFDPDLYVSVAPHVRAIQCRAESVPASLPDLSAGVEPPWILHVVRDGPDLVERVAASSGTVIIDAAEEGSGKLADPARVRRAVAARPGSWLAGGLTPDNVAQRILDSGAVNVDVSSGIESAPGVKDPARMRDFVIAARTAQPPLVSTSEDL